MKLQTLVDWQEYVGRVNAIARRVTESRRAQGWALAASVGIGRCGCSLHNAAIDDDLKGWCAGNPRRLKVAKRASWMVNEWAWEPSRLADVIGRRAWNRLAEVTGFCRSEIV